MTNSAVKLNRRALELFILLAAIVLALSISPAHAQAPDLEDEIEYLIDSVGRDGCRFLRNDRSFPSRQAREHLRSKWRLNAHLIASTEDFIEKLASSSATTGRPYLVSCRGERSPAGQWFFSLLERQRRTAAPPVEQPQAEIEQPSEASPGLDDSAEDVTTSPAILNRGAIQRRPVN